MFRKLWLKIPSLKEVLGRMGKYGRLVCLLSVLSNTMGFMTSTSFWQWVWLTLALGNGAFLAGDLLAMAYWTWLNDPETTMFDLVASWWRYAWREGLSVRALKRLALSAEERRKVKANEPSARQRVIAEAERIHASEAVLQEALRRQAMKGEAAAFFFLRFYKDCSFLLDRAQKVGVLAEAEKLICESSGAEMHGRLRLFVEKKEATLRRRLEIMEQAKGLPMEIQIQVAQAVDTDNYEIALDLIASAKPKDAGNSAPATVTSIRRPSKRGAG